MFNYITPTHHKYCRICYITIYNRQGLIYACWAVLEDFASVMRQTTAATKEQATAGSEVARQVDMSSQESTAIASAITEMSATTNEVARTAADLNLLAEEIQARVRVFQV